MSVFSLHHQDNSLAHLAGLAVVGIDTGAAKVAGSGEQLCLCHIQRGQVFKAFIAGKWNNVFHHVKKFARQLARRLVK